MSNTNRTLRVAVIVLCTAWTGCASSSDVGGCVVNRDCMEPSICVNGQCVIGGPINDTGGPPDSSAMGDAGPGGIDARVADAVEFDTLSTDAHDSSAGDADTSDAGRPDVFDAGPPPPINPACTTPSCNRCDDRFPSALICESFDEEPDSTWSTSERYGGSLDTSTVRFASGGGALHVVSPPDSYAYRRHAISPSIRGGSLHARLFVLLPVGPEVAHFAVVANFQERSTNRKLSLDIGSDDRAQTTAGPMGESVVGRPGSVPRGQWVCLEFSAELGTGGDPGSLDLRVDGRPMGSVSSPRIHAGGGFDEVWVGIKSSSDNGVDVEVFMDEFVVSREGPIGCADVEFAPL